MAETWKEARGGSHVLTNIEVVLLFFIICRAMGRRVSVACACNGKAVKVDWGAISLGPTHGCAVYLVTIR